MVLIIKISFFVISVKWGQAAATEMSTKKKKKIFWPKKKT
jgi:hypothetical protein